VNRHGNYSEFDPTPSGLLLPTSWAWATLGSIADIKGGITKGQRRREEAMLRLIPYLRVANVQRGFLDLQEVKLIAATENEIETLRLEAGDILFNEGGDRDKLGRGWVWRGEIAECIHQNHVFRGRLYSTEVEPKLISWYGNSFGQQYFIDQGKQTTNLASINLTKLAAFPIPLPPANEQRRIVAAIEEQFTRLDAAVAGLRRVRANLKRYRAAVLKAACEGRLVPTEAELARAEGREYEPADRLLARILEERRARWEADQIAKMRAAGKVPKGDGWKTKYEEPSGPNVAGFTQLPEGWSVASLEAVTSAARVICYGILMPKEHVENGVPYVKVRDMKGDRLDVSSLQRTSPEIAASYARASLQPGDVLLAIRGTYGRVVHVPAELDGGNITQDTARLAVSNLMDARYMMIYLRSDWAQRYFKRVARGVAVKGVNIADVRLTPVLLPPAREQQRIVVEVERRLSVVEKLEATVEANLRRAERTRQAILRRAFEGKLVPQDPNDEPAGVLLERIRAERAAQAVNGTGRRRKRTAEPSLPLPLDV
jgi:type I restriction enzyme S subunit